MRVTLLGTAAARPTPGRNVSAVLVEWRDTTLLLDCGEGTYRQLLRYTDRSSVQAVFVSHMHADHYLGIAGVVSACIHAGRPAPEAVWIPGGGEEEMAAAVDLTGVPAGDHRPDVRTAEPRRSIAIGSLRITPFRTRHRADSLGYVVETVNSAPAKVVYTGDTRPSGATVNAARGADLLIHEATFCEDERARARKTAHSTALEAAEVAAEAGVRQLVLTHLSARYADDPRAPAAEARAVFAATMAGRDGMHFDLPELHGPAAG